MEAVREYSIPGGRAGGYSQSISPRNALIKKNIVSLDTHATHTRAREQSLLTMPRGTSAMKHGLARQQLSSRITR
jgi:hypothetical protein